MKKSAYIITSMILPVIVILAMIHLGCEEVPDMEGLDAYFKSHPYLIDPRDNPDTADLLISPLEFDVTTEGEEIAFTVSGGESPFTWDTTSHSVGVAQVQANDRDAIYTAFTLGRNNVIVSDSRGHVAIAKINADPSDLEISPDSVTLNTNLEEVNLTVTGGTRPYYWTVVYPALGTWTSDPNGPAQVTYQRITGGDNIVLVEDYHGRTVEIIVSQPGILVIIPSSANIVSQGQTIPFTATGGEPPYFWSAGNTALGNVDTAGLYTDNTNTVTGDNSVFVYDSGGHSVSAVVTQ